MNYEIQNIELKEESGFEFLVLTTKPLSIYEKPHQIVAFDKCTVDYYKDCIEKYKTFENLPISWKMLTNVVYLQAQLKKPLLIKNNALGTEYETSTITVLCKYCVDDEAVARGELEHAVKWVPGWSPEERVRWYDNKTTFYICEGVIE